MVPAQAGVVPTPSTAGWPKASGPRARGGGPPSSNSATSACSWSPRTRGWSRGMRTFIPTGGVVPAHAGVVPGPRTGRAGASGGPRARGGGPFWHASGMPKEGWSPRTRGWSRALVGRQPEHEVVPAHAGVVPSCSGARGSGCRGPRARGGGPAVFAFVLGVALWSPRTRGWSRGVRGRRRGRGVVPAHAGVVPCTRGGPRTPLSGPRARGGGPAYRVTFVTRHSWSPRTRGWSLCGGAAPAGEPVVPAHAGVVPGPGLAVPATGSGPRARGGGPDRLASDVARHQVVPAHAGVVPSSRSPSPSPSWWSPHTRGWSRALDRLCCVVKVVPAHAGVVP